MEHAEAKSMHAAEMYVLGELRGDLREQFEEHYFDCPECALDVRAAAAFIGASKEIFQQELAAMPVIRERNKTRRWRGWLKPLVAIPAMAALVMTMVYEGRNLKRHVSDAPVAIEQNLVASAEFALRGGDRIENETTIVRVREGEAYGLHFDFTPSKTFDTYWGELQDQGGRVLMQVAVPSERINKEVKFVVPAGKLPSGNYVLWIYGQAPAKAAVAKYSFTVELTP
ncbi:MAG TPA: zf-HC2 domain-containing protein [Candidatus Acidoferrum sp.]|nr:zf-HC2 domain-containing protein [Candidatus Acidoferrum sp.]